MTICQPNKNLSVIYWMELLNCMDLKKLQEAIILHLHLRFSPDCDIGDLKFEINF